MSRSDRLRPAAVAAGVVLWLTTTAAQADLLQAYSGNTAAGGTAAVTYDFAVYSRNGSNPSDVFNTGLAGMSFTRGVNQSSARSPVLDTSAQFLYVYQIVNNSMLAVTFNSISIPLNTGPLSSLITSWGAFTLGGNPVVFKDNNGLVGSPPSNNFGTPDNNTTFTPNASPNTGVTLSGSSLGVGNINTTYRFLSNDVVLNTTTQILTVSVSGGLGPNGPTTIFAFTSNVAPSFLVVGSSFTGGGTATGSVPVPQVPEPATLVMAALGAPLFVLIARKLRRRPDPTA